MTLGTPCDFCLNDCSRKIGFNDDDPHFKSNLLRRLHRRYSVRSGSALEEYLIFLKDNVTDACYHVHFSQLMDFAKAHEKQEALDWASSGGRFLEAIHHITMDTHLPKCDREIGGCHRLQTRIDDWQFHSFSKQPSNCQKCSASTVDGRVDYKQERRDVSRVGTFRMIKDPIHACSVELDLGVVRANLRPRAANCPYCGLLPAMAEDMVTGRSSLINTLRQARLCTCPFSCINP